MDKSRRVLVAALGTMTPALLLEEKAKAHAAHQASTVEAQRSGLNATPAQEAMKRALLALSPADKLRLAGDRIHLAKTKKRKRARGKAKGRGSCKGVVACKTGNLDFTYKISCVGHCSGMLFAWN